MRGPQIVRAKSETLTETRYLVTTVKGSYDAQSLCFWTGTAHSRLYELGAMYPDARILGGPLTEHN